MAYNSSRNAKKILGRGVANPLNWYTKWGGDQKRKCDKCHTFFFLSILTGSLNDNYKVQLCNLIYLILYDIYLNLKLEEHLNYNKIDKFKPSSGFWNIYTSRVEFILDWPDLTSSLWGALVQTWLENKIEKCIDMKWNTKILFFPAEWNYSN